MIRREPTRPLYDTLRRWLTLPTLVGAAAVLTLVLWAIWLVLR